MDSVINVMEASRGFVMNTLSLVSANMSLDLAIKIALGYFFVIWGAFIIWVIKDITNRTSNILIQTISIFIVLLFTPIFGLPIYLLIRPRTTIFEQYYEEGEFEEEDDKEHLHHCGQCNYPVEPDFHYCPKCRNELVHACGQCEKMIRTNWEVCPYCGKENLPNAPEPIKKTKKIQVEVLEKDEEADLVKEESKS